MAQPTVRQNPDVHTAPSGGEFCPEHGLYRPPREALQTRRQATGRGVPALRAQRLLERAEHLRRSCPQCAGPAPSTGRWATRIRCGRQEATDALFAPRCPWCSTPYRNDDPAGHRHRCP